MYTSLLVFLFDAFISVKWFYIVIWILVKAVQAMFVRFEGAWVNVFVITFWKIH